MKFIKLSFFSIALAIIFYACSPKPSIVQTVNYATPLDAIIESYEAFETSQNENSKTNWNACTIEAFDFEKGELAKILNKLNQVHLSSLSSDDKINHALLKFIIDDKIENLEYQSYLFPLSAEGGFLTEILYSLQNTRLVNQAAKDNYRQKLAGLPDYMDRQTEMLKLGIGENKMMPKIIVERCISQIDQLLSLTPEKSFMYAPCLSSNDQAFKEQISGQIEQLVFPAYAELKSFLKTEYLPKSPTKVGASEMSGGEEFYEQRIRYYTTYDISPDEVFEIGKSEVARIKAEMMGLIEKIGFEGDFAEFLNFLRTDAQFYPKSEQELISYASFLSKKIEKELPKYFGKLPRMPFTVVPVPASIAENYTTGRYSPGSYENHKAGEYWVNTTHLESRTLYTLPALTLHEAVPGHHLQIMLAKEIEGQPKFRQSTYLSAYGEGWGLYAEYLGLEAGMYEDDYDNFGRLTYEMWRACRLVVDVGMHYKDWNRQEAIDFMAENTALSMLEVISEIDRYIGWPAQAVSYKMGELKIKALRKKAEDALGGKFDIRAFHDCILANGSILLSSLESEVDQFIIDQKSNNE